MDEFSIYKTVREYLSDVHTSKEFWDLVTDTLSCIDDFDNEEDIRDAIDTHTMYTEDMWTVLIHYTDPHHAFWHTAIERFYDDIVALIGKIKEADK